MREFRFLDEKRKTNGLNMYEEQRWQGLAAYLGIDLFSEAQSWGQWGSDGQWYPYPGYEGYYPPEQAYGENYAHYQQGYDAAAGQGYYAEQPNEGVSAEQLGQPGFTDASYEQTWIDPSAVQDSFAPLPADSHQNLAPYSPADAGYAVPQSTHSAVDPVGDLRRELSLDYERTLTVPEGALAPFGAPQSPAAAVPTPLFSNPVPWRRAPIPPSEPIHVSADLTEPPESQPWGPLSPFVSGASFQIQSAQLEAADPQQPLPDNIKVEPLAAFQQPVLPTLSHFGEQAPRPTLTEEKSAVIDIEEVSDGFSLQTAEAPAPQPIQLMEPFTAAQAISETKPASVQVDLAYDTALNASSVLQESPTDLKQPADDFDSNVEPISSADFIADLDVETAETSLPLPPSMMPVDAVESGGSFSSALSADDQQPAELAEPAATVEVAQVTDTRLPLSLALEAKADSTEFDSTAIPIQQADHETAAEDRFPDPPPSIEQVSELDFVAESDVAEAEPALEVNVAAEPASELQGISETMPEAIPLIGAAVLEQPAEAAWPEIEQPAPIEAAEESPPNTFESTAPEAAVSISEPQAMGGVELFERAAQPFDLDVEVEVELNDVAVSAPTTGSVVRAPAPEPLTPLLSAEPLVHHLEHALTPLPLSQPGILVEAEAISISGLAPRVQEKTPVPLSISAPMFEVTRTPNASSDAPRASPPPQPAPSAPALPAVSISRSSVVGELSQESDIIEGIVLDDEVQPAPALTAAPTAIAIDQLDDLWPNDAPVSAPRPVTLPAKRPQTPVTSAPTVAVPSVVPVQIPQPVQELFDRSGTHLRDSVISVPVPGEHRVILHTLEGQVKRGALRNADLGDETIELNTPSAVERISRPRVKAIFFLLPAGGRATPSKGSKVRVTFKDGRQVAGYSSDHKGMGPGFFVVPADNRTNTERIYIYRHGISTVVAD